MVVVPAFKPVTLPFSSTVAMDSSAEVHTNVLSAGFTVACKVVVPFNPTVATVLSKLIETLLFAVYTDSVSTVSPFTNTITDLYGTVTFPFVTVERTSVPALSASIHTFHVPFAAP